MNLSLSKLKRFSPQWEALKKIGKFIGRTLLLSPADEKIFHKKILCPAIEKGEISVALGSKFLSRIKIIGFKNYPYSEAVYPPPQFLASSLGLATAELGVKKPPISLSIPKAWAVIKTVEYPSSVLENLAEVVTYELDRITPFTPETAYYDFKILKEEEGRVFILVAAARADLVDSYLRALRDKEFKVESITIDLLGLGSLGRQANKLDRGLIIEIEKDQYQGALFIPETHLEVISGSFDNETEKNKLDQINQELESLMPFAGQKGLGETLFYLKDKSPTLRESIKLQTRHPVDFLDETDLGFGIPGKERKQIPYTAIGGIIESLWPKSWGLNLFIKGVHPRPKPPWVLTILLLLTLGVLVGIYWTRPLDIETNRLHDLEKQIALKKGEVKKVEDLKKEIETLSGESKLINDFKQSKPLDLDILKELTVVLPKDTWLTRVRVFESQVSIEGYAPSATLLIPRLEGGKFFKKVEFAAPTFKDPRQNMDRFQLKMELKSP
jgi:general secretion pathway protein L